MIPPANAARIWYGSWAMPPKKLPYRPNVCMLVYNAQGKLFLGERRGEKGHWQFPQGGAEPRYTLRENVFRELREELGLRKRHVGSLKKLRATHQYEWRSPPGYAIGRWRGQRQSFWLVEFVGEDGDIDLSNFKEPEFRDWRWCSVSEVRRRAARHRLKGYEKPLREFLEFKKLKAAREKKGSKTRLRA